jgi:hypothetical protein
MTVGKENNIHIYIYRDLGQPMLNKFSTQEKHHLCWRWITGWFLHFFRDIIDSIRWFQVVFERYELPDLATAMQSTF